MNIKTICFINGVGSTKVGFSRPLSDRVAEKTGAQCFEHIWEHNSPVPPSNELPDMSSFRGLAAEIILDFLRAISDYIRLSAAIPPADMYVSHSAGSIIAAGLQKPQVIMGSPLRLIFEESIRRRMAEAKGQAVLNLINRHDVIAFRFPGYENKVITPSWYDVASRTIPLVAHTSYWKNQACAEEISAWFKTQFPS